MVQLDLTPEERQILAEVLQGYLKQLRFEIANTESIDFRRNLNHREDVVVKALSGLSRDS